VDRDLERRALQFYAQKIRDGSDELYYHYRFYETHFMLRDLDDEDELLRIATLRIFKSDPYAYAGTFPFSVDLLNETEIEEIAASITFGGDEGAATLLRGQLWADAAGHGDDRAAFAERAVAELEAVPDDLRSHDYWGKARELLPQAGLRKVQERRPNMAGLSEAGAAPVRPYQRLGGGGPQRGLADL
jgi:hypothetical protein